MTLRIWPVLLIGLLCISCGPTPVENAPPGVTAGKFTLINFEDEKNPGVWFDFTTGGAVYGGENRKEGDFCLFKTFLRSSWPVPCGIQDSQADSLYRHLANPTYDYVTPNETLKNADVAIYSGHVYYMQTAAGLYARIKVVENVLNFDATAYEYITFYWAYQPEGHEYFGADAQGKVIERIEGEEGGEKEVGKE
jgi:hypothetical protein